ncbi:unnamed protein product [Closterium sp. Yama58-4]|nr:unnamed protein product [Closterium sp. Yama58-4]
MAAFTELRARASTTSGTVLTAYSSRGFSAHASLPFEPASGGKIASTSDKAAGRKINFSGWKISGVAVSLQYLLSLLAVSLLAAVHVAGNPPLPPAAAPPATPRLVLLANNSFDAKCLDGSPPGYYFRPGTGGGKSMWHIYLPHGGWCFSPDECLRRSRTASGSSTFFPADPTYANLSPNFKGILSSSSEINPHFHDWNLVRLIYCDGGGYSGTAGRVEAGNGTAIYLDGWKIVQAVIQGTLLLMSLSSWVDSGGGSYAGTAIYLDGWKIVQAVIQDLKSNRAIRSADQILLVGSSAGGQAAVALCDRIAGAFPWAATKCISDSGFFVDSKDREGGNTWRAKAQSLVDLHKPSWPACMHGEMRCMHTGYRVTTWHAKAQSLVDLHKPSWPACMHGEMRYIEVRDAC